MSRRPPSLGQRPLMSILVPTRGRRRAVTSTIRSVFSGRCSGLRIVIVGSTDASNARTILRRLLRRCPHLQLLRLHGGVNGTRNLGLTLTVDRNRVVIALSTSSVLSRETVR